MGRENEARAYENMLTQFPEGAVAVVSDSYNVYEACEKLWGGELRARLRIAREHWWCVRIQASRARWC